MINKLYAVGFAAGGMQGGLVFFVLYSECMVWLRFGYINGWCIE